MNIRKIPFLKKLVFHSSLSLKDVSLESISNTLIEAPTIEGANELENK